MFQAQLNSAAQNALTMSWSDASTAERLQQSLPAQHVIS